MDITPLVPRERKLITGYGAGGFKINGEAHEGNLLILQDHVESWKQADAHTINESSLSLFLNAPPQAVEILLIGTGRVFAFVDISVRHALRAKDIALEVMDTGAACRTYNVLLAEERRVGIAAIAV